jgi:hypothetical protein
LRKPKTAPSISQFLVTEAGERRIALLHELVQIDRHFRARIGQPRGDEEYLAEFPEPAEQPASRGQISPKTKRSLARRSSQWARRHGGGFSRAARGTQAHRRAEDDSGGARLPAANNWRVSGARRRQSPD